MNISQEEISNKSKELKDIMHHQNKKRIEEYHIWFLKHSKINPKEIQNTNKISENYELNANKNDISKYPAWFKRHCIKKKNKKIEYYNGEYYIGEVYNNMANGKGILYYKNGNIRYEGEFINDKFEGKGKFFMKIMVIMVIT